MTQNMGCFLAKHAKLYHGWIFLALNRQTINIARKIMMV
jgi:hypothetical protein